MDLAEHLGSLEELGRGLGDGVRADLGGKKVTLPV